VLAKFDQKINSGHYSFPFSMQIPLEASGSYILNGNINFRIYFPLKTYLVDYNNPKEKPEYIDNITVVERPRIAERDLIL